jgi:hypothetical protein
MHRHLVVHEAREKRNAPAHFLERHCTQHHRAACLRSVARPRAGRGSALHAPLRLAQRECPQAGGGGGSRGAGNSAGLASPRLASAQGGVRLEGEPGAGVMHVHRPPADVPRFASPGRVPRDGLGCGAPVGELAGVSMRAHIPRLARGHTYAMDLPNGTVSSALLPG